MLKLIGIAVVVLIVALLVYAATRSDTFRLQRSTSINAPPEKIFPFINDFHQWLAWSPWEKVDPTLEPQGASTNVTWAMYGPQPFMAKVMSVFCMMDRMVGPQFDTGLANLKTVAEK